jgi:DNA-binding CsgD family transcriptional regulator
MMLHGRRTGNAELQARYADKWVAAFDSANAVLTEIYFSLRAEAAAALGDFQTAYHLATKGKDLVWRLAEHRAAPELQDARARLQTSLAEQEAQLLELKVNNRNLLIAIALSVTAVLGVGLLVLMIRARLLRTRQLLANQTANLAKQEAQLAQAEAIEMKLKADAAEKERELAMLRETDARLKADIQIAQAATERQKAQLNLELTVQRLQERRNLLADLTTRLRAAAASESGLQLRVFRLADHLSEEADAEDIDELVKLAEQNFFQYLDTFYSSLQARATDLTPYDLKLAGLLRMGKSSKQIASILGITTASVDNSRSRLRQKLNLEPDVNLQNWLRGLGNQ